MSLKLPAGVNNFWQVDPSVYQDAQKQLENSNVFSKSQNKPYVILKGGDWDHAIVADIIKRHPIAGYELARVEVIFNRYLVQGFEAKIQSLEQKHGNDAFKPSWEQKTKNPKDLQMKKMVDYTLTQRAQRYAVNQRHVIVLPMFHGTHPQRFDSIFRAGYDNLAFTDAGYFGKGIYNTSFAQYSWTVYSQGGLLMNWVAFFSAFPVSLKDMDQLMGAAKIGNYDANYVLVRPMSDRPDEKIFIPVEEGESPMYDELVVFESSQVLPRYIVTITPTGLNAKSVGHKKNKTSLKSAISKFLKLKPNSTLNKDLENKMSQLEENKEDLDKADEWMEDQLNAMVNNNESNPQFYQVLSDQLNAVIKLGAGPKKVMPASSSPAPSPKLAPKIASSSPVAQASSSTANIGQAKYEEGMRLKNEEKFSEAFDCFKEAADQGNAQAQYQVGLAYKFQHDFANAIVYMQKAADQGIAKAQDYIGHCYFNGFTLKQDYSQAVNWFKQAAAQGNESSIVYLALCFSEGMGVNKNEDTAFFYWKQVADKGNGLGSWKVAEYYKERRNFSEAMPYAIKAAEKKVPDALDYMGHCYYNGYSVDKDYAKAVEYFKAGADLENASCLEYLGLCYARGHGVDKDDQKSAGYFEQAAGKGRAISQYSIGVYYKEGIGVAKNLEKARDYFELAANQGHQKATEMLQQLRGSSNS